MHRSTFAVCVTLTVRLRNEKCVIVVLVNVNDSWLGYWVTVVGLPGKRSEYGLDYCNCTRFSDTLCQFALYAGCTSRHEYQR